MSASAAPLTVNIASDATSTTPAPETQSKQITELTMAEHLYRYKVQMTCGGCSGAINRVLTKAKDSGAGVNSFSVSLENQSVEVRGPIAFDDLTSKIEKTGKKILEKEEVLEDALSEEALAAPPAEPVSVA